MFPLGLQAIQNGLLKNRAVYIFPVYLEGALCQLENVYFCVAVYSEFCKQAQSCPYCASYTNLSMTPTL